MLLINMHENDKEYSCMTGDTVKICMTGDMVKIIGLISPIFILVSVTRRQLFLTNDNYRRNMS